MRRFSLGDAVDRKVVVIDVQGKTLTVVRMSPDGSSNRQEKALPTEAAAQAASDKLAQELMSRGYTEHGAQVARSRAAAAPVAVKSQAVTSRKPKPAAEEPPPPSLFDDLEAEDVESSSAPMSRLAPLPSVEPAAAAPKKKKKKSGKKRGTASGNPDALDRRVLAAFVGVGLMIVGGVGYMMYDAFLKPPSIVGIWKGSMVEHEISRSMSYTAYALTLDAAKNATFSMGEGMSGSGTYSVKGNRLFLKLKDEDGEEIDQEFKITLGRSSLALIDPSSGKMLVDLVRQFEQPASPVASAKSKAAAAKALVDDGDRTVNAEADKALASVELGAKDGAFRLRHPPGWTPQTGGKADNTYSYILLDKGSAKISVYADITGALVSGADSANPGDFPEGSEFAPIQKAHEHYAKSAGDDLSGYQESKPEVFKDFGFGEGRLSVFTASAGMFGGKLKGYHVTGLTRDRRISLLAYGPEADFAKLRPTFLAVARSLAR